jgi:hypothetical protein
MMYFERLDGLFIDPIAFILKAVVSDHFIKKVQKL